MAGAVGASGSSGSRIRLIGITIFAVLLIVVAVLPIILFKPQPLQVSATANPRSGPAPLTVFFEGSAWGGSGQLRFRWDFGDGNSSSDESPKHTYQFPGTFNATFQVSDLRETRFSPAILINSTTTRPA